MNEALISAKQKKGYSLFFESIKMVTGPSFTSEIFISAPRYSIARPLQLATAVHQHGDSVQP